MFEAVKIACRDSPFRQACVVKSYTKNYSLLTIRPKGRSAMPYYVYVLLCTDGSYYTGYARNIDLRVKQHKKGVGARYTKLHKPKKLVYAEKFENRKEAMRREKEIKKLSHEGKQKLAKQATSKH